jgi:hypothetical protein
MLSFTFRFMFANICFENSRLNSCLNSRLDSFLPYTAIPYRASTGPEQGFPCVLFPRREKPIFITGFPGDENRFFPVRKSTQEKPCFHYRGEFAVYLKRERENRCFSF